MHLVTADSFVNEWWWKKRGEIEASLPVPKKGTQMHSCHSSDWRKET